MIDFISVKINGSGTYDSTYFKSLLVNNDKHVKARFISEDSRSYQGRFIVSTDYKNKENLDKLFAHVRGFASHAIKMESELTR